MSTTNPRGVTHGCQTLRIQVCLIRPNRLPMRPVTPEKKLILEHLFKGASVGGQDSSSLKGTRETFSRFWDIVELVFSCCLRIDVRSGYMFHILLDLPLWVQVAFGFFVSSLSWSLGLVFCRTLNSYFLRGVSLHHGSHLPSLLHELSHKHSHSISLSLYLSISLSLSLPLKSVYCKTRDKSY